MDKWEYMQVTFIFSSTSVVHALAAVIQQGKRRSLPPNVRTRSEMLDYYAKLGWIAVKSYSDVYTFKRERKLYPSD